MGDGGEGRANQCARQRVCKRCGYQQKSVQSDSWDDMAGKGRALQWGSRELDRGAHFRGVPESQIATRVSARSCRNAYHGRLGSRFGMLSDFWAAMDHTKVYVANLPFPLSSGLLARAMHFGGIHGVVGVRCMHRGAALTEGKSCALVELASTSLAASCLALQGLLPSTPEWPERPARWINFRPAMLPRPRHLGAHNIKH